MQLIGLDIGTTSVCAVSMDASTGVVLRSRTVNSDAFIPGNLCRGVLEGMAAELYGLYEKMGLGCQGMVGAGNGVRKNAHFVEAAEKRFGMKMKIPAHVEEAACGAALYAGVSANVFEDAADAGKRICFK